MVGGVVIKAAKGQVGSESAGSIEDFRFYPEMASH